MRAYRLKIEIGELTAPTYIVDKPYVDRFVKRQMTSAVLRRGTAGVGSLQELIEITRARAKKRQR